MPPAGLVSAGLLFLALGIRGVALDRDELWFDEAFAALVAAEPIAHVLVELARDSSPPLYYLLLHGWTVVAGADPTALRWFSVGCGVLAVWLSGAWGSRLWGVEERLAAFFLVAVSPLHIYYSREVRPYSLFLVLALGSFVALERLRRNPGSLTAASVYSVLTLAAIYTHNYGLLLLAWLGASALANQLPRRTAALCGLVILAGYLPWLPVLLGQFRSGATMWVARWWAETPPAAALVKSLAAFCIGGLSPPYIRLASDRLPKLVPWAAYTVFAFLVGRALLTRRPDANAYRLAGAVVLLLGLPFTVSFIRPMYLVARYDVVALPLFLLLSARGAAGLRNKPTLVLFVAVSALAGLSLTPYFARSAGEGARHQATLLVGHAGDGDVVLCTGFSRNALEYYVRLAGDPRPFYSFPTSFGHHRGWLDEREVADPRLLEADALQLTAVLSAELELGGLLWIAHSRELTQANEILMHEVLQSFRQVACPGDAEARGFTCWRRSAYSYRERDGDEHRFDSGRLTLVEVRPVGGVALTQVAEPDYRAR